MVAGEGVPVAAVVQETGQAAAQVQQDTVNTPAQVALVLGADPDDQSDQQLEEEARILRARLIHILLARSQLARQLN